MMTRHPVVGCQRNRTPSMTCSDELFLGSQWIVYQIQSIAIEWIGGGLLVDFWVKTTPFAFLRNTRICNWYKRSPQSVCPLAAISEQSDRFIGLANALGIVRLEAWLSRVSHQVESIEFPMAQFPGSSSRFSVFRAAWPNAPWSAEFWCIPLPRRPGSLIWSKSSLVNNQKQNGLHRHPI